MVQSFAPVMLVEQLNREKIVSFAGLLFFARLSEDPAWFDKDTVIFLEPSHSSNGPHLIKDTQVGSDCNGH